jgi:hypothetical protein
VSYIINKIVIHLINQLVNHSIKQLFIGYCGVQMINKIDIDNDKDTDNNNIDNDIDNDNDGKCVKLCCTDNNESDNIQQTSFGIET